MAIPAQNLVFTWGGIALQEVRQLDVGVSLETDTSKAGRDRGAILYTSGEMTLTGFSAAGLEQDKLLQWGRMRVTVPISPSQRQVLWDGYAQYVASTIAATTNGPVLFAFQFRLFGAFSTIGDNV